MNKRTRNAFVRQLVRFNIALFLGIFIGYKLKEYDIFDIFIQTIDHRYFVFHNFCEGKIPHSSLTNGHIVLHYNEIKEIAEALQEKREAAHDLQAQGKIDTQLGVLAEKMRRKQGENVCPELLVRTLVYANPFRYFENDAECEKLKAKPKIEHAVTNVNNLVTFMFDLTEDDCAVVKDRVKRFEKIDKFYPHSQVVFGVHSTKHENCQPSVAKHITIVMGNPENIWQKMLDKSYTLYTFLGRDIVDFDKNVDMSRVLREFRRLGVPMVGGSFKTVDNGHWYQNCHQMDRTMFNLYMESGYRHSYHDCLYCDYFRGPIVAETQFLREKLDFTAKSSGEMFLDLFFRTLEKKSFSAVCPDVMYHMEPSKLTSLPEEVWLKMAKRYELVSATDEYNKKFTFPCDKLKFEFSSTNKHYFTHPCPLSEISNAVVTFMSMCRKYGIHCQLTAGQLLGAVKFNRTIPWDYDADILFHPDQGSMFDSRFEQELNQHGYNLMRNKYPGFEVGKQDYFNLIIPYHGLQLKFDVWPILSLDKNHEYPRTKVLLDGEWMESPENPVKDTRDFLGPEVFKHETRRTICGFGVSVWDTELPDADVPFPSCPRPNHHACLDRYLTDGSIQFKTP